MPSAFFHAPEHGEDFGRCDIGYWASAQNQRAKARSH